MKHPITAPEGGLSRLAHNLTGPAHSQELIYGSVIYGTLQRLNATGLGPKDMGPELDELGEALALKILEGKSTIINSKG